MLFMLKELYPGSTDFTVAIFETPPISKLFSAMLKQGLKIGVMAVLPLCPELEKFYFEVVKMA